MQPPVVGIAWKAGTIDWQERPRESMSENNGLREKAAAAKKAAELKAEQNEATGAAATAGKARRREGGI